MANARQTPAEKYADLLELARLKQSAEFKSINRQSAVDKAKNALHARVETRRDRIADIWDSKVTEADHVQNMDESVLRRILAADRRLSKLDKAMDLEETPETPQTPETPETPKGNGKSKSTAVQTSSQVA